MSETKAPETTQYERCESTFWHGRKRCADRTGHDGEHHNAHWSWDNSEQDTDAR